MSIGNLFGTGGESNSLYGTSFNSNVASSYIYFEWFIFKVSTGQPTTPTGGSWDFSTNTGTPPTGWTSTVSGVPLDNLWFSIAFVDSRNPTNIVWSTPGLIASSTSAYATAYADTFTGNGSTTSWTLTADPVVINNLDVSINGVTQTPTVDYTISGTTFTTTTAAPIGSIILVKYRQALPNSYYGTANNVGYTPAGTGAVATNVQNKLRENVSVKDFGAVGDGVANDTTAIQNAINAGKFIHFPAGTYKFSTLQLNHDNCILVGDGQKATVLTSTATSGSIIYNPDQATVTRYYCGIKGMQIVAPSVTSTANVKIIDWRSMQFGSIEDVWIFGNSTAGLAGVYLGTVTYAVTECTYNYLKNLYIGGVGYGVQFFDGANTNTLINCRVQPGASAYGYHLAFGTGADTIGNNTFINCACEYPGNTVTGYALGAGANNTTIISPRLEGLSTGIQISSAATNTTLLNAYFDSNITNVSNASTTFNSLGADGLTVSSPDATPNFGVDFSFYGYPGGRTRYLGSTGGGTSVTNDAFTLFEDGVYGSTYAGGTNFGVGASGSYRIVSNGNHALGTSDPYWLGLASNNTVRAKIQINGAVNFVPLASDPAGSVAGDTYYNSTTNKLRCYNGTSWNDLF